MSNRYIVIFDGVCNFCNGAVNFIIDNDSQGKFVFTPMQSGLAKDLISRHGITNVGIDTFLLIKNNECFIWTDAALEIAKDLDGRWHLFRLFKAIPRPVRDFLYRAFARNRYALFGKRAQCRIPGKDILSRFVGIEM